MGENQLDGSAGSSKAGRQRKLKAKSKAGNQYGKDAIISQHMFKLWQELSLRSVARRPGLSNNWQHTS